LFNAATLIVEHNRSPNLIQAWATWDDAAGVLSLTYLTAEAPSHNDEEWCELSMAELLSEFSDIVTADTGCFLAGTWTRSEASHIVFVRTGR